MKLAIVALLNHRGRLLSRYATADNAEAAVKQARTWNLDIDAITERVARIDLSQYDRRTTIPLT